MNVLDLVNAGAIYNCGEYPEHRDGGLLLHLDGDVVYENAFHSRELPVNGAYFAANFHHLDIGRFVLRPGQFAIIHTKQKFNFSMLEKKPRYEIILEPIVGLQLAVHYQSVDCPCVCKDALVMGVTNMMNLNSVVLERHSVLGRMVFLD